MATYAQLVQGLQKADQAGDVEAAKAFASEIGKLKSGAYNKDNYSADPTQDMSTFQKAHAGFGKAFSDIATGAGQMVGLVDRADVDARQQRDRALMNTGAGMTGNILGNVAAMAPAAMIPGANTVVGSGLIGAGTAAFQPVGTDDSRMGNMALGGAAGAAVPAAINVAKGLKAMAIDPFTQAGRTNIAGRVMRSVAADPDAAAMRIAGATGATPGFMPTVGQAADDDGLAALERTMRAIDKPGFNDVGRSQRGALIQALRNVAQTPEARSIAVREADDAVRPLYAAAKSTVVPSDDVLENLLSRPSLAAATDRASRIAAERGGNLAITRAQTPFAGGGRTAILSEPTMRPATTSELLASPQALYPEGNLTVRRTANTALPEGYNPQSLMDALSGKPLQRATYRGDALHYLKMGLDDAIGSPTTGGIQGAERSAALDTKGEFLNWLDTNLPEYADARNLYTQMMRPVNQMDIGQELYNRYVPALNDFAPEPFKTTANAFAKALREGDELARNVTGMKGTTLSAIMEPDQLRALEGVAQDAALAARMESAGRGVGSDTVEKISMSNIASQAGVPNWMSSMARVPGGWAKRIGDLAYSDADQQIRMRMAELFRNLPEAAMAMQQAGMPPKKIAEVLRLAVQAPIMAIPAIATE